MERIDALDLEVMRGQPPRTPAPES
jgi:hypothetical protein